MQAALSAIGGGSVAPARKEASPPSWALAPVLEWKVVGYPPLCEMGDQQRREFHEALLEAGSFEELPGKWQAAVLSAEQNRP